MVSYKSKIQLSCSAKLRNRWASSSFNWACLYIFLYQCSLLLIRQYISFGQCLLNQKFAQHFNQDMQKSTVLLDVLEMILLICLLLSVEIFRNFWKIVKMATNNTLKLFITMQEKYSAIKLQELFLGSSTKHPAHHSVHKLIYLVSIICMLMILQVVSVKHFGGFCCLAEKHI